MKTILKRLSVLVVCVLVFSCSKDSPTPTTSLEITLRDELGNIVPNASVELYSSLVDWDNSTNQVGTTQYSDATGKVKFDNLSNIIYYWSAEKDCKNNYSSSITTSTALILNVNNPVSTVLSSTGTLKLINNSSNPYAIYINGAFAFNMNGGTTWYNYYKPIGSYSIRVIQLSGFIFTPTDETFTGTLSCGQTLTTTFP